MGEIGIVEIYADGELGCALAAELAQLRQSGPDVLAAYLRNVRMALYDKARQIYLEVAR